MIHTFVHVVQLHKVRTNELYAIHQCIRVRRADALTLKLHRHLDPISPHSARVVLGFCTITPSITNYLYPYCNVLLEYITY